jgi:hypothetical protein
MNAVVRRNDSTTRIGHDLRGILLFTLMAAFLLGGLIVIGFMSRRAGVEQPRLEGGRARVLGTGDGGDS